LQEIAMAISVFIIESSYPEDYYKNRLDGQVTRHLLNILRVKNKLRFVLNLDHFKKALREASHENFQVIHLSCHGDDDGVALADNCQPTWDKFAGYFQSLTKCPPALVMSACCGAASGIGDAFKTKNK